MKNNDIKLIATDMDGTFLNDQHQYDQDLLRKVLASCKEKGIYFAAASGRALLSLKSLFKGFEDQMIFIAENGSVVEFHGEDLYEATMSKDFYLGVFEALKSSPYADPNKLLLTGKKGSYVLETVDIQDEIFKLTTNFDAALVLEGEQWVTENIPGVKAMTTGFESIDIVLDYVDKGVAITALADKLGISMDQVMAFGDNLNDLHMMQVVGHPVAPENARPEILAIAETVIGHHATGSVLRYMEEIV